MLCSSIEHTCFIIRVVPPKVQYGKELLLPCLALDFSGTFKDYIDYPDQCVLLSMIRRTDN